MDAESTARSLLRPLAGAGEWPLPSLREAIIACGEAAVRPLDELLSTVLPQVVQDDDAAYWLLYSAHPRRYRSLCVSVPCWMKTRRNEYRTGFFPSTRPRWSRCFRC